MEIAQIAKKQQK